MNNTKLLDKNMTRALKGLAILFMFFHHFYGFPDWHVNPTPYLESTFLGATGYVWLRYTSQFTVDIFVFLTGWGYFHTPHKTLKYGLGKIYSFLKYYWFQLFFIFTPIAIFGGYQIHLGNFILDMFGLAAPNLVTFAWYTFVYIFIMLTFPIILKFLRGKAWFDFTIPFLIAFIVTKLPYSNDYVFSKMNYFFIYTPVALMGYLCVKYNVLDKVKMNNNYVNLILFIVLMFIRTFLILIGLHFFTVYLTPFIILTLIKILSINNLRKLKEALCFIGDHATNIWMTHSLFFFSYTSGVLQPFVYWLNNPLAVVLLALICCLPVSYLTNYFVNYPYKKLFKSK